MYESVRSGRVDLVGSLSWAESVQIQVEAVRYGSGWWIRPDLTQQLKLWVSIRLTLIKFNEDRLVFQTHNLMTSSPLSISC